MGKIRLDSWKEVQKQVQSILDRINADPLFALAAAASPLFALEELGYEVDPDLREDLSNRLRFGQKTSERLRKLREAVFRHAGHPFDLGSAEELRRVLFDELRVTARERPPRSAQSQRRPRRDAPDTSPLPPQLGWGQKVEDPLKVLRGAHPIMDPLLEYRRLEASEPRLASRALYDEIRRGERRLPVARLRGVLKVEPVP
jgi:hypothetical protein